MTLGDLNGEIQGNRGLYGHFWGIANLEMFYATEPCCIQLFKIRNTSKFL